MRIVLIISCGSSYFFYLLEVASRTYARGQKRWFSPTVLLNLECAVQIRSKHFHRCYITRHVIKGYSQPGCGASRYCSIHSPFYWGWGVMVWHHTFTRGGKTRLTEYHLIEISRNLACMNKGVRIRELLKIGTGYPSWSIVSISSVGIPHLTRFKKIYTYTIILGYIFR